MTYNFVNHLAGNRSNIFNDFDVLGVQEARSLETLLERFFVE
jgi:hypothetical protein